MSTTPDWPRLAQQLSGDAEQTDALYQLLQNERDALAQRDYDRFQNLLENKRELLARLESGLRQRQNWLNQAGFPDEQAALEAAQTQAPEIAGQWRQLAEQWRECQTFNTGNEQIALRTRQVVGRMLDILRGNNGPALYDARGHARLSGGGQTIGDA